MTLAKPQRGFAARPTDPDAWVRTLVSMIVTAAPGLRNSPHGSRSTSRRSSEAGSKS